MPQPTPPPPDSEPPPKPATPPERPPPRPDAPKPAGEGAIFHALLDAGIDAKLAYTAEKRMHTMISETGALQLQPFVKEMSRRFDEHDRRFEHIDHCFEQVDRRFEQVDRRFDEQDRRLDEHDRKLDVIVARLDGFKLLGQIMIGAYALLITVLIAVFGLLFANAN